ncbi:cysteine proteinase, partial [Microstroma glucosiphilum]
MEALLAKYLKEPLQWEASQLPSASVKYRAINEEEPAGPVAGPSRLPAGKTSSSAPSPSPAQPRPLQRQDKSPASSGKDADLFPGKVPLQFPGGLKRAGAGLHNRGNTCYMNSTMQALLHTPPLAHLLLTRDTYQLKGRFGGTIQGFDPVKALQSLTERALTANGKGVGGVTTPVEFIKNLRIVARTFHTGRQEDAHEWLRLLLESVQQACLASASPAVKQSALKETTFIQKIFGGKLLSRVTCLSCQHNSDTFDPILDLSLDIRGCDNLGQAMSNFTQIDELRGSEKYKCEKCKRLVVARKQFTLDKCPEVLTVHLKRFTFTGSKLSRAIAFPDKFKISPSWTSNKQPGPTYSLYAVVHHHGGGPHSGHYVAEVKSPAGVWCDMNDDFVSPQRQSPAAHSSKSAYMLFYVK